MSFACADKTGATPSETGSTGSSSGDGGDVVPTETGDGHEGNASTGGGPPGATSGAVDGSEGADTATFLQQPDGGIVEMCDPGVQDCPRGQKCSSYVSVPGKETVDATHCVDIMGDDSFGEACERIEGNDTCDAGFFCMTDVSGHTGMGICLEYCIVNQPCEFGGTCFAFNDGALPVCQTLCDPLIQNCPSDQGCYAAFDNFVCAMPGPPVGGGNDGDSCGTIQGCNPGLVCKDGTDGCPTTQCCTPICDLSGPADQCTAPEMCLQALDDPPPNLSDVGYCTVPQ
jgi:hypothetical protein